MNIKINKKGEHMNVAMLNIGEKAYIKSINYQRVIGKRLLALGCIKGTKICVKKIAPLKDAMVINFRGFDLAIRIEDAKFILVSK